MVPARVQNIKLMDLSPNPVELPVEILDRGCVTFLEFVGQKSESEMYRSSYIIDTSTSIVFKRHTLK